MATLWVGVRAASVAVSVIGILIAGKIGAIRLSQ